METAAAEPQALEALRRNPLIMGGAALSLLVLVMAILAPVLSPAPADAGTATHPTQALRPPSWEHPFGTDQVGRDLLTRVLYGARVSPAIAVLVLGLSCLIGVPLGLLAGYLGGLVDDAIMRVTDVFLAFPPLLLALAFATKETAYLATFALCLFLALLLLSRGWPSVQRRIVVEGVSPPGSL